jgi:hypothetical protein
MVLVLDTICLERTTDYPTRNKMKKIRTLIAAAVLGAALQAHATSHTLDYLFTTSTGGAPNVTDVANELLSRNIIASAGEVGTLLYLFETNGNNEEVGAGLFETTIVTGANNLQTATLTYTGGTPVPDLSFVVVFAANQWSVFDARDWDGGTLVVDNRGLVGGQSPNLADISNIRVYGGPGGNGPPPPTGVPDGGGTLAMLGLALIGLASASRMKLARKQ